MPRVTTRSLHPNTRALIARVRASLSAQEPSAPSPAPAPVVDPAPFQLTPYAPKAHKKTAYTKGPSAQTAFAFAAPAPAKVAAKVAAVVAAMPDLSEFIVLDTETTGIAVGSRIVEVAALHVKDGVVVRKFQSLVNPEMHIPSIVQGVHGITDAMVADAPAPAAVAQRLRAACGDRALVFHNAPFDLPFLIALFREAGEPPLLNPIVDTLGLARGLFGTGSNALGALATRLGLPKETAHRALGDARTTARLFLTLAERWEREKGVRSLAELAAASQDVMRLTARR